MTDLSARMNHCQSIFNPNLLCVYIIKIVLSFEKISPHFLNFCEREWFEECSDNKRNDIPKIFFSIFDKLI